MMRYQPVDDCNVANGHISHIQFWNQKRYCISNEHEDSFGLINSVICAISQNLKIFSVC